MSDTNPVVGILDEEIDLVRKANDRAEIAEVRAKELDAQCAAMREALEVTAKACHGLRKELGPIRSVGRFEETGDFDNCKYICCPEARSALSGDAGRALRERMDALERDLADKLERCARGARALIDLIGAHGPEHIDETCARAAKRLEALENVANEVRCSIVRPESSLGEAIAALDALEPKR